MDVRFDVEKGPRAVAGAPRFSAPLAPLDEATLLAKAKSKRGKPYRGAAAREDAERFAAAYRRAGYSRAEVRLDDESYDAASATVTPHYALFVGPRVVLKVTGESEKVVRAHPDSPWTRGEPSDEDSLQLLKDGLRRTYQEKGYARAKVDVTFETTADEELVAFAIEKGERWTISSVKVTGAASLPRKDVFGALQMRPRGLLESGRYVDGDAAADRDALEALYRANGFRYARVSPPAVTEGASRDTLDVTFKVEEGLRTDRRDADRRRASRPCRRTCSFRGSPSGPASRTPSPRSATTRRSCSPSTWTGATWTRRWNRPRAFWTRCRRRESARR